MAAASCRLKMGGIIRLLSELSSKARYSDGMGGCISMALRTCTSGRAPTLLKGTGFRATYASKQTLSLSLRKNILDIMKHKIQTRRPRILYQIRMGQHSSPKGPATSLLSSQPFTDCCKKKICYKICIHGPVTTFKRCVAAIKFDFCKCFS